MLIFVTGQARSGEPEVSSAKVLDLDGCACLHRNVGWIVAPIAGQFRMFALKQITRLFVVEGFCIPFDQGKLFSIVLGMAARAFLTGTGRNLVGGVQSFSSIEPRLDFGVAFQAFQCRLSPKLMASRTVRGPIQRLVGPRERAGRNLRKCGAIPAHEGY